MNRPEDIRRPEWPARLLRFFLKESYIEEIEGDLEELFHENLSRYPAGKARRLYIVETLRVLRPFLFKDFLAFHRSNLTAMINNYFKSSLRHIRKNKAWSAINIAGLSAGIAVTIIIALWIADELTFNHYHKSHERIAQVMTSNEKGNVSERIAIPLGEELRAKFGTGFSSIALSTQLLPFVTAYGDKAISTHGIAAEPGLTEMLTLEPVDGNITALKDPSSVLVSSSLAKRLFGNVNPIGKVIQLDNKTGMKVAAIYKDIPPNSNFFETDLFVPWDKYIAVDEEAKFNRNRWGNHNWRLFVQVNDPRQISSLSDRIKNLALTHLDAGSGKEYLLLHPMDRWHLYNEFENGQVSGGRIRFVWLFGMIASFVLFLAAINFINLSTARSEKRAKEVGIRKAIGSRRHQLVKQFLTESVLICALAFVVSLGLVQIFLPAFNRVSDKSLTIPWADFKFWSADLFFIIVTGFIAGIYPAFYLSRFNPVKVLKGTFNPGKLASLPRQVLVVLQFSVSVSLIIATVVIFRQLQFGKDREPGFERDRMIMVHINTSDLANNFQAIHNEALQSGAAESVALSSSPPTDIWSNLTGFEWEGKDPTWIPAFATVAVSHDFGKTMGWTIKEGRDFSRSFPTDTGAFIINEAAAKLIGFKNPVGKIIRWEDMDRRILGVVKDMVMESPFAKVRPTVFFLEYGWRRWITLRLAVNKGTRESLAKIESIFKRYNPGSPFEYNFTSESYGKKFAGDERIGTLAFYFATLAIFISCLGLFALASYMAEQRAKEIGIRKVLGASVSSLWVLLSGSFMRLVFISCMIAIPFSWFALSKWLEQYQYRVAISGWIILGACVLAGLVALATVSVQTIKAAFANPARSIRSE